MGRNMNSGYSGYRMSNRAVVAYSNGEKPLSKWTKKDIMTAVTEYIEDRDGDVSFTLTQLNKAAKSTLINLLLRKSSWHHTSSFCNSTVFYSVDVEILDTLTDDKIQKAMEIRQTEAKAEPTTNIYKGTIKYIEWSGSRRHPRATEVELKDVNIEEKGCFYLVTNNAGKLILKKKIDSNGTVVIRE